MTAKKKASEFFWQASGFFWQASGFFWHLHHNVLLEYSDDIDERITYIKANKPENEVAERLRLLQSVKGELPSEFMEVEKAWEKAWEAREKAQKAREKYKLEIEILHKKECPNCTWDGKKVVFNAR